MKHCNFHNLYITYLISVLKLILIYACYSQNYNEQIILQNRQNICSYVFIYMIVNNLSVLPFGKFLKITKAGLLQLCCISLRLFH